MASSSRPKARLRASRLGASIGLLRDFYGPISPPAPKDPFELLMWEYVAYLTDDADRAAAFERLRTRVGLTPAAIAQASLPVLRTVCRAGGSIAFEARALRMHEVAVRVLERFDGTLAPLLKRPYLEAQKALKTFPSVGPPGADKIVLLTGAHAVLALDSNALRVLLRLGYGFEHKNYSAAYASAQKAAMAELPSLVGPLREASLLLRHHGRQQCGRTRPRCAICPLRARCAFAKVK